MKYWDASALVPCCLTEEASPRVRVILAADAEIVTCWFTMVECWSAFTRLRRDGTLQLAQEELARRRLGAILAAGAEIMLTPDLRLTAGRLVRIHPLKAADSIQLAAALEWARHAPEEHEFVCLDDRLRDCARLEGFMVVPE